ncbi:hypothetical protein [Dyadobacter arcticus]|uniref:Helix-turn-helix domain-containing protein n=1 Tax=Dyadobacter arcticus TaxID=1078754 RepID=A0ABX0UI44_9BACT|nr:hypothetical protein [Dyadobacter arcticus]NIJ52616.1 hypothetical protein [Dyadobacter arcticus]
MERSISQFFGRILLDKRLKVWHVGTYLALVLLWDQNRQSSPFPVTRRTIMHMSRTKSTATYHKYLKELESFGYIRYEPSHHPKQGSQVWMVE